MADTTDDAARRLTEIRARADAATPGPWAVDALLNKVFCQPEPTASVAECPYRGDCRFIAHSRSDILYLLDLLAARDKELAELRGMLADLCEDSRAAATAMRYRRALQAISAQKHQNESGMWWDTGAMCRIAREAMEGESDD